MSVAIAISRLHDNSKNRDVLMRAICVILMSLSLGGCASYLLYNYGKPKDTIDHVLAEKIDSAYKAENGDIEICFTRYASRDSKIYSVVLPGSSLEVRKRGVESVVIPWSGMVSGCQRKGVPIDVVKTSEQMCRTYIKGELLEPDKLNQLTILGPGPYQDAVGDILYPPGESGHTKRYAVTVIPEKSKDYSKSYALIFMPFTVVFDVVTSPIQGLFLLLMKDMPSC